MVKLTLARRRLPLLFVLMFTEPHTWRTPLCNLAALPWKVQIGRPPPSQKKRKKKDLFMFPLNDYHDQKQTTEPFVWSYRQRRRLGDSCLAQLNEELNLSGKWLTVFGAQSSLKSDGLSEVDLRCRSHHSRSNQTSQLRKSSRLNAPLFFLAETLKGVESKFSWVLTQNSASHWWWKIFKVGLSLWLPQRWDAMTSVSAG